MATDRKSVRNANVKSVCEDPDIAFAVVFGSRVSGESTPSSDLDIAVKFADELSEQERFEKRCFLSGNLQDDAHPFVDVSDIESLPVDVARDAVDGTLLCGDERAFEEFKRYIKDEFTEQRKALRRQQRAVIDRIAEDGLRG